MAACLLLLLRAWATRGPRSPMWHELRAWDTLTSFIAMPIGNALAGPLSSRFGVNPVRTVCSAILLASAVSQLLIPGTRKLTRTAAAPPAHNPPEVVEATTV